MWVMAAISGLMCGSQFYQGSDAPFYNNGLRTQIIMVAVGIAAAAAQIVIYVTHNRRVEEGKGVPKDGSAPRVYVP